VARPTGCACENTQVNEIGQMNSGTWSVEGTNLVVTAENGESSTTPYCRVGDALQLDPESDEELLQIIVLAKD
jgi:hypothetical protein